MLKHCVMQCMAGFAAAVSSRFGPKSKQGVHIMNPLRLVNLATVGGPKEGNTNPWSDPNILQVHHAFVANAWARHNDAFGGLHMVKSHAHLGNGLKLGVDTGHLLITAPVEGATMAKATPAVRRKSIGTCACDPFLSHPVAPSLSLCALHPVVSQGS